MREFKVKKPLTLEEGKHSGKIIRVEYRDEPYAYVDIVVVPDKVSDDKNPDIELRYGCPQNLSLNSKFGKLLISFGMELKEEAIITEETIATFLTNKKVTFVIVNEVSKAKDGSSREFARIADGSLKVK